MNETSQQEYAQESDILDLQSIYSQLCISNDTNFDTYNELEYINKCIESCFTKEFLQINSDKLSSDHVLFNNSFIKLVKYANTKNYKKLHMIFVCFCTYFNIDEVLGFKILHEKIQDIIKNGYVKMVGKDTYKKMYKIYSKNYTKQISLFDLVKNKH